MSLNNKVNPPSALHSILEWSKSRPDWQRDALRRIVVNEIIEKNDLDELDRLCRSKHEMDVSTDAPIVSIPLSDSHIPSLPGAESSVSLVALSEISGVNRLAAGSGIQFGTSPGLTMVFGENGTGKSGYVRILKKSCRARGVAPIIKYNVFEPPPKEKPSANIVARVGGREQTIPWIDGTDGDPVLSNIFVFDGMSASHYLQEDDSASFTPFGLDILPVLSKLCDAIAVRLKAENDGIKKTIISVSSGWQLNQETKVGKLIASLSARTTNEALLDLSSLTDEQKKRVETLDGALKLDPIQKAKETRAVVGRLRLFVQKLEEKEAVINDQAIELLKRLVEDAESKKSIAEVFKERQFDSSFLLGTGSFEWRTMWEAAREYSKIIAYKDFEFPKTNDGSKCVLCQQKIEGDTKNRLKEFEAYCQDQSQRLSGEALLKLSEAANNINQQTTLAPELTKVETDLIALPNEIFQNVKNYSELIDKRLLAVQLSLKEHSNIVVDPIPTPVVTQINEFINSLEARAKTEESANDPVIKAQLQNEFNELKASEWLASTITTVNEQIDRLKTFEIIETCLRDTNTSGITHQSTILTQQFINDSYCEKFETELNELGLSSLKVRLAPIQGKKGETKFGLRIVGAEAEKIMGVASEGEQRCIALAAFLAELSQASHQSALIFDDPVSSLDNSYRESVAKRLADESKTRQVIVFTHDVVFLNDIQSSAELQGITPEVRYLEWCDNVPGYCSKGLPWDFSRIADRFDTLEKEQRSIRDSWNPVPNDENKNAMRHAYSRLRATLERIVEKEILCDAVFRFRSYIDAKKLEGLIGFSLQEYEHLMKLFKRCHDITDAHDPAVGRQPIVPNPAELAADIAESKQFVDEIKNRRKLVKQKLTP